MAYSIHAYLVSSMAFTHCKYAKVRSKLSILPAYSCNLAAVPSPFVS